VGLEGKGVLVPGASKGIGRATTLRLAEAVYFVLSRSEGIALNDLTVKPACEER
jgi:NAD(P)-dependent dehydrogenase (short-subunit alcohol dehydrogenase family)